MLNEKQKRFAREYLIDRNATQAAIRAGYSERTAHAQGCRLLKHAEVQALVAGKTEAIAAKLEITAERVLQEMARLAFGDIRKIFGPQGELLPIDQIDDDTAAGLAGVEFVTVNLGEGVVEHVAKIKTVDKTKALEMLGRHLQLFKDKIEVEVNQGLADRMAAARQRRQQAKGKANEA